MAKIWKSSQDVVDIEDYVIDSDPPDEDTPPVQARPRNGLPLVARGFFYTIGVYALWSAAWVASFGPAGGKYPASMILPPMILQAVVFAGFFLLMAGLATLRKRRSRKAAL